MCEYISCAVIVASPPRQLLARRISRVYFRNHEETRERLAAARARLLWPPRRRANDGKALVADLTYAPDGHRPLTGTSRRNPQLAADPSAGLRTVRATCRHRVRRSVRSARELRRPAGADFL